MKKCDHSAIMQRATKPGYSFFFSLAIQFTLSGCMAIPCNPSVTRGKVPGTFNPGPVTFLVPKESARIDYAQGFIPGPPGAKSLFHLAGLQEDLPPITEWLPPQYRFWSIPDGSRWFSSGLQANQLAILVVSPPSVFISISNTDGSLNYQRNYQKPDEYIIALPPGEYFVGVGYFSTFSSWPSTYTTHSTGTQTIQFTAKAMCKYQVVSTAVINTWSSRIERLGCKLPTEPEVDKQGGQPAAPSPEPAPAEAQAPPSGAQALLPANSAQKTFQEFNPPGTKGGPMVYVSDFKFYIDKYEVTNQDFQECVAAGACKATNKKSGFDGPKQPVVYVNKDDARTYCKWAGKRLPKEKEWQEAAQGTDGRTYPWGNQEPNCSLVNYDECKIGATLPVGSKPAGASPYGALDMAGNVYEWVKENGVVRGGGWNGVAKNLRVSASARSEAYTRYDFDGGFRCARD